MGPVVKVKCSCSLQTALFQGDVKISQELWSGHGLRNVTMCTGKQIPLPSSGWQYLPHHLQAEALWQAIRDEAMEDAVSISKRSSRVFSLLLQLTCVSLYSQMHQSHSVLQETEPAVASFLHTSILGHASLAKAMAFMLANKLTSRTLLGTQLVRIISAAYADDPVCPISTLQDELRYVLSGPMSFKATLILLFCQMLKVFMQLALIFQSK